MQNSNVPPRVLKSTVGIDSIHLRIYGVNKKDIDRFCSRWKLAYGNNKKGEHKRTWKIFLAGGQPISVHYHFSSKTTTFQIGRLMNYSRILCEQHKLLQRLISDFQDRKIHVSAIDISVDIKEPLSRLSVCSNIDLMSIEKVDTTLYHNRKNGSVLCVYDKAVQMQIYSTSLTRIELRFSNNLKNWKVEDLLYNKASLDKFAQKVKYEFVENIEVSLLNAGTCLHLDVKDITVVLENFVAMLHGATLIYKDPFKVSYAIEARDRLKCWMKRHRLKTIDAVEGFVKGSKAMYLEEVGLDHKTFNKAMKFYEGIPNFRVG